VKGLFHLQSPKQLLEKLRHDFARLKEDPVDAYAAFDFFVTARHMPEWLYPDDPAKCKVLFDEHVLLRVCRHIAEGSKHFRAKDPRHNTVKDLSNRGGAFQPGAFQSNAFQVGRLFVELDGEAVASLGTDIEVVALAERILGFWDVHPDLR
jgi:hypothetical protein